MLRKYMKDNNLTYGKVSKYTGIDRKALWLYWNGDKSITLEMAKKLSKAYGGTVWHWWEEGAKSLAQDGIDVGERDRNIPPNDIFFGHLARLRKDVVVIEDIYLDIENGCVDAYLLTDGRVVNAEELKMYEPHEDINLEDGDIVSTTILDDLIFDNVLPDTMYQVVSVDPYESWHTVKLQDLESGDIKYVNHGILEKEGF